MLIFLIIYYKYKQHLRKCKIDINIKKCFTCRKQFLTKNALIRHAIRCSQQIGFGRQNRLPQLDENSKFKLSRMAFKNFLQMYELFPERQFDNFREFFIEYRNDLIQLFRDILNKLNSIKVQFCVQASFSRNTGDIITYSIGYFCTENFLFTRIQHFLQNIERIIEILQNMIEEFEEKGSDWVIEDIDRLDIRIAIYNPLTGGCHRPLPEELKNKRAIINIINKDDNKCFVWCVLASLYPPKCHPELVSKYQKYLSNLNLKNFKFPMNLNRIERFEDLNRHLDIGINIFTWSDFDTQKSTLKPIKSTKKDAKNIINLLLLDDHYFYIKNINRLIGSYSSTYHHFCLNCFSGFRNQLKLKQHKQKCLKFKPQIIYMPSETNKKYYFKQYEQCMKFPYAIYADFESVLIKSNTNLSSKSKIVQKHEPCGYCIIVIKNDNEIYYNNFYRGPDAIQIFLEDLKQISFEINNILSEIKPMIPLTTEEEINYESAQICHICEKPFTDEPNDDDWIELKVKDHDHLNGNFRGAAHFTCNLKYQIPGFIPLFFHNLKGYDSHFLISNLNNKSFGKCEIIPQNIEKFITFKLDSIQVLDSYQFLSESLDTLVNNLKQSNYDFPITCKLFEKYNLNEEKKDLLFKKGIYPYEWMDNFSKFDYKYLPNKNKFYSSLTSSHISDESYSHALKVWKIFDIKTMGQYHDFYINLDTSLLSDVFQAFRRKIYDVYKLDPCHFFSIPGLTWSAVMKYTDVRLELLTDVDMYEFCETGIRGGISCVSKRFCKANNKYLNDYNPEKETIFLTYLDFNNLYGFSLSQHLPQSDFKWLKENKIDSIDWNTIDTENTYGFILEVDLIYPENLHELHNDFPVAPHKYKIMNDRLSEYQKKTIEYLKQYGYRRTATEKLLQTFDMKLNYIIHFKNLKLYLKLGLKLTKIHRVLSFKQSKFLEPYIKLNTNLRKKANNSFEKDLFKLMNNAVFGKSIQDQRKHLNIKLAFNEKQASRWIIKPKFETFNILDEEKVLIKMRKTSVKLNRPIYIGFTVPRII